MCINIEQTANIEQTSNIPLAPNPMSENPVKVYSIWADRIFMIIQDWCSNLGRNKLFIDFVTMPPGSGHFWSDDEIWLTNQNATSFQPWSFCHNILVPKILALLMKFSSYFWRQRTQRSVEMNVWTFKLGFSNSGAYHWQPFIANNPGNAPFEHKDTFQLFVCIDR